MQIEQQNANTRYRNLCG